MKSEIVKWDYQKSVEKMRPLVMRWKDATAEIAAELWEARRQLSDRGSKWNDDQNWTGYLEAIGLSRTSVHRLLVRFDPETQTLNESEPRKKSEPKKLIDKLVQGNPDGERADELHFFDDETIEADFIEVNGEEPQGTDPNEAVSDIRNYADEVLAEIQSVAGRHQVCAEMIKFFRNKAAELDRQAKDETLDFDLLRTPVTVPDDLEIF